MNRRISDTQVEQLTRFRNLLGESEFQRIQQRVWREFSRKPAPMDRSGILAPLALHSVWDDLIRALSQAQTRARLAPTTGVLWELLKEGVMWTAVMRAVATRWEVGITRDGRTVRTQQFSSYEQADAWADKECVEIANGWRV